MQFGIVEPPFRPSCIPRMSSVEALFPGKESRHAARPVTRVQFVEYPEKTDAQGCPGTEPKKMLSKQATGRTQRYGLCASNLAIGPQDRPFQAIYAAEELLHLTMHKSDVHVSFNALSKFR